jgi:hypothetical protein
VKLAALLGLSLTTSCGVVHAQDTKLVGYECAPSQHRLTIAYRLEAGADAGDFSKFSEWNPWTLVSVGADRIDAVRTIRRTCRIGRHAYALSIGPSPGNWNLQGSCGAEIGAWTSVRRDGVVVLPRLEFEGGDCHSEEPVITRVEFGDGGKPSITKVPFAEFYESTQQ